MERPNFGVNGGLRLPIGYRFRPTDEELVVHYLRRKVFGIPLPASVIPEFDVFKSNPWDLPGDLKEKSYFFSNRKGNENGKRAAGCGHWKPIGKDKQIFASNSNQRVGIRQKLLFYEEKRSHDPKTQWVMLEYSLPNSTQIPEMEEGDWVICHVFQRKRKPKRNGVNNRTMVIEAACVDYTADKSSDFGPPLPSPSSSNEVTEFFAFDGFDHEGESRFSSNSFTKGH